MIDGVVWPASLQRLTFGDYFNQPIEGVRWPESIRELSFGRVFDQRIDGVAWPASLSDLSFGVVDDFRHGGIYHLYSAFNHALNGSRWPASLRRLSLGSRFHQSLNGLGSWMPNLEELCLLPGRKWAGASLSDGIEWPNGLRKLTVYRDSSLERLAMPQSVRVVYRERWTGMSMSWPSDV